jgi:hypothetical protein
MKDVLSVEVVPKKQNGDILVERKELTFSMGKCINLEIPIL